MFSVKNYLITQNFVIIDDIKLDEDILLKKIYDYPVFGITHFFKSN